jgi:hypothetical protein
MEMTQEEWRAYLAGTPDEFVRRPLWVFPPASRPAVISERKRRFGVLEEEDMPDPDYH